MEWEEGCSIGQIEERSDGKGIHIYDLVNRRTYKVWRSEATRGKAGTGALNEIDEERNPAFLTAGAWPGLRSTELCSPDHSHLPAEGQHASILPFLSRHIFPLKQVFPIST